jgi:adenylate cyclase
VWIVAGVVVVALVLLAMPALMMNVVGPIVDGHRRKKNDHMVFDYYCATGSLHRFMRVYRHLPASPRCKLCYAPFGGMGRVLGIRPSRKNSNFCRSCFETVPVGGSERVIGVLFADLRGFTAWSGDVAPADVASALEAFYRAAMRALMAHDAIIDKFVGDSVMALFLSDMPSLGQRTCDEMVLAAVELMDEARIQSSGLGVGIGINYGTAWVGNVGNGEMKDFTALGDVVNVAARLQGCAEPGQILLSEEVFTRLHDPVGDTASPALVTVKGKPEPIPVHVMTPGRHPHTERSTSSL